MRPLDLSPRSSDEYEPVPPSPVVAEAARRARDALNELVSHGVVSRRELFMSAAASAAVLSALTACSTAERAEQGDRRAGWLVRGADDDRSGSGVERARP